MNLRNLERALLTLGLTLCAIYLGVLAYREIGSRMAIRSFEAVASSSPGIQTPPAGIPVGIIQPDYSLWSAKRIGAYRDSLMRQFAPAVAILRIPKLGVEVAVFDGTDELVLNRGVGRIIGSTRVGETGNIGIAGHRDGFFRVLKDIAVGDLMTLSAPSATTTYSVDQIEIVTPDDVTVLGPRTGPSVTLVTCYPFYHSGDAPQRFIVHGIESKEQQNR
ncbi:MAG TPA: class D sortase [Bryobacteraceae bacterium]|nr:class D sortase [Bryobacteraceae bacterium]